MNPRDNARKTSYTEIKLNKGLSFRMTYKAKDLSPDQKIAIESLLGRAIAEHEEISIRTVDTPPVPEWLKKGWETAQGSGIDQLSVEEIDAEIAAARKARRESRPSKQ